MKTARRNRKETENKLRAAGYQLLVEKGIPGFGVNAVAAAAGVDKVLIYRYFESIDGLLEEVLEAAGWTLESLPVAEAVGVTALATQFLEMIAADPLQKAALKWDAVDGEHAVCRRARRLRQAWYGQHLHRDYRTALTSLLELLAAAYVGSGQSPRDFLKQHDLLLALVGAGLHDVDDSLTQTSDGRRPQGAGYSAEENGGSRRAADGDDGDDDFRPELL